MKKKILLYLLLFSLMLIPSSCGKKDCKAEGCSEEIYEEGLCKKHYFEKAIKKGIEEIGDLFD
ncbi:hypothetical protein [Herbinix luporum]|jgi:hypothetical protein|uniref:Putative secreted protein n=1 Tax=Herbinix luporum TaxID=1679721 RepID=A0A0K8J7Y6_9FIRM|nr:hypothetical protein [Herbinix luporum]MDI9489481.1 hypothetical protein [Bacillota bacterium]CUH93438.1 putative secreted protein [Herbinix luporum]HHT56832.1 hypothetical protein [Herbinix luporum]